MRGQPASAPSLVMCENAVTAHRDITALFSLLSCLASPVPLFLLLLFSLNISVSPPTSPLYSVFSPFVRWVLYTVLFFSLSLSLAFFFPSLFLARSIFLHAIHHPS